MIAFIKGILIARENDKIIVDVNGVGYEIFMANASQLPENGSPVSIYTFFHKTDDSDRLFGFGTQNEKNFFKTLISIPDKGPKVAITILSSMGIDKLKSAIASGDSAILQTIPRVGKKLAERIVVELKDKLKAEDIPGYNNPITGTLEQDAVSALVALGYNVTVARNVIDRIGINYKNNKPSINELVRDALRELGTGK
ncbi:MAG: Holliday junction branch migration protein RuvA [Candidatus Firestonebacteria bacterium]